MVKFSFSLISSLTLSFVNRIMGRKEGHYSLGPEHMHTTYEPSRLVLSQGRSRTFERGTVLSFNKIRVQSVVLRALFDRNPAASAAHLTHTGRQVS